MNEYIVHGFCDDHLGALTYYGMMHVFAHSESEANDIYTDAINAWVDKNDFNYLGDMPVTQTASKKVEFNLCSKIGKINGKTIDESIIHLLSHSWAGTYIRCIKTDCTAFNEEALTALGGTHV